MNSIDRATWESGRHHGASVAPKRGRLKAAGQEQLAVDGVGVDVVVQSQRDKPPALFLDAVLGIVQPAASLLERRFADGLARDERQGGAEQKAGFADTTASNKAGYVTAKQHSAQQPRARGKRVLIKIDGPNDVGFGKRRASSCSGAAPLSPCFGTSSSTSQS